MADVGANPSRIIAVWAAAVELHIGFQALARVSMTRNTKVRDVAEELVRTGALPDGRGTP